MAGKNLARATTLCVLKVLEEYSDVDNPIKMGEIIETIKNKYHYEPERRAIYPAIELLTSLGYEIDSPKDNGEKGYSLRKRKYEESEIRLLTDAIYSYPYIDQKNTDRLIKKVQSEISQPKRSEYQNIFKQETKYKKTPNEDVFENIKILDEAIKEKKIVEFDYCQYNERKTLVKRREEKHRVMPYGMKCTNGKYYLIGIYYDYDKPFLFRIDLIKNIEKTEDSITIEAKDAKLETTKDLTYAYVGKPIWIEMKVKKEALTYVIDQFGSFNNIQKYSNDENYFKIKVSSSPAGVKYWALQFIDSCEILSPDSVRKEVIELIKKNMYGEYKKI